MANVQAVPIPSFNRGRDEIDSIYHRGAGQEKRLPFTIATEDNIKDTISFWINPMESQWRIATRTTIEQIAGGAIHHEWQATGIGMQEATKFDQPVLTLSFQTGIITPNAYEDVRYGVERKNYVPSTLGNFYDFLGILNAPNIRTNGLPNYVNMFYTSATFPGIWLRGFFSAEGVQWTDSGENPYSIQGWGASFVVFRSDPPLFDPDALRQRFKALAFRV